MTLNGIFVALVAIMAVVCYAIGHLAGEEKESKRATKDLMVLNDKIREINGKVSRYKFNPHFEDFKEAI